MLIIGLTGGIASGKSTATNFFHSLGVPVIDADQISHKLVEPGNPAFTEITAQFGNQYIGRDGRLDRARLRRLVFADPSQRVILENILHPRIRHEIAQQISGLDTPYCIVCIPLLVETGQMDLVDRVLVIDAPVERQVERLQRRDALSDAEIQAILDTQASRQERLRYADDIVINDGSLTNLHKKLTALHHEYLDRSSASTV